MNAAAVLDGSLIRRRRQHLGLSECDAGTRLGTTGSAIHSLELGNNRDTLSAVFLVALASLLGLTIAKLFTAPSPTEVAASDVQVAGALLTEAGRRIPIATLAEVCGWDLEHAHAVLDDLAQRLGAVGQVLQRTPDLVGVVSSSSAADPDRLQTLLRLGHARDGMSVRTATVLHRVVAGTLSGTESDNTNRVALGEVIDAGLVVHDAGDRGIRPALHPDVDLVLDVAD